MTIECVHLTHGGGVLQTGDFVHVRCALWSSDVHESDSSEYCNVIKAIRKAERTVRIR
jgi:hypothetical protein